MGLAADDATMNATASDQLQLAYQSSGSVALLGIANNNRVALKIYAGLMIGNSTNWGHPGAEVTPGGTGAAQAAGGRLRYTLYNNENYYKITVETREQNYVDGSLSVEIININAGGSSLETLGTKSAGFVPIRYDDPQNLITGIDGSNTWTGTAQSNGPWLRYKLDKDPGGISGSRLPVLYTLVAQQ